jgi:hypothetical protein
MEFIHKLCNNPKLLSRDQCNLSAQVKEGIIQKRTRVIHSIVDPHNSDDFARFGCLSPFRGFSYIHPIPKLFLPLPFSFCRILVSYPCLSHFACSFPESSFLIDDGQVVNWWWGYLGWASTYLLKRVDRYCSTPMDLAKWIQLFSVKLFIYLSNFILAHKIFIF